MTGRVCASRSSTPPPFVMKLDCYGCIQLTQMTGPHWDESQTPSLMASAVLLQNASGASGNDPFHLRWMTGSRSVSALTDASLRGRSFPLLLPCMTGTLVLHQKCALLSSEGISLAHLHVVLPRLGNMLITTKSKNKKYAALKQQQRKNESALASTYER